METGPVERTKRHTLAWIILSTAVVLFAGHVALTSGTVFLLPEEMSRIELGMTREEVWEILPAEWLSGEGPWILKPATYLPLDTVYGKIGGRSWSWNIHYCDSVKQVSKVERRFMDWPEVLWRKCRLRR